MPTTARPPSKRPPDLLSLSGVLRIEDLARILRTSDDTIRKRLREGTFPIPPLRSRFDNRLRWAGPVVQAWLADNGRDHNGREHITKVMRRDRKAPTKRKKARR